MTDTVRQELLAALATLSSRYPDWRFGQLVENVAGWADRNAWDVEDAELLAAIKSHLRDPAELEARA